MMRYRLDRRWAWPAVALMVLAVLVFAPRLGFSITGPAQLWNDHPPSVAAATTPAPNWVELAKVLKPAVVNISTKRVEEGMSDLQGERGPQGQLGPDELFQRFFHNANKRAIALR